MGSLHLDWEAEHAMVDVKFYSFLLKKYGDPNAQIYITDAGTRILAATEEEKIGSLGHTAEYIIRIQKPATIEQKPAAPAPGGAGVVTYGTPVYQGSNIWGTVIVTAPGPTAAQVGDTLRVALESALAFESYRVKKDADPQDEMNRIAAIMLADPVDLDMLLPLMHQHELEPNLLRTVICIRLEYHENNYFNISLNLGYQSSIEQLRKEVERRIRHSRYLNSQDLITMLDRNTLLVLKSFQPTEDLSRIYLALDVVCRDLSNLLNQFSAFSFSISYGNLYPKIEMLSKSWHEAENTLLVGKNAGKPGPFYSLDMLLFETVCRSLQPQIVNKLLNPSLQKLYRRDGTFQKELIGCCEAFVDHCMNLSKTSEDTQQHRNTISARLKKLQSLTGLDPTSNFKDAFLVKMLAIYAKQAEWKKSGESTELNG